jgi:hypothetical protein
VVGVVLGQSAPEQLPLGSNLWSAIIAAVPAVKDHRDAVVWFDTPRLTVDQMDAAGAAEKWFVSAHIHEKGAEGAPPLLDAVLQIDARGHVRSFVAGQSKLYDARTRIERERQIAAAADKRAALGNYLARVFAEFPPERIDEAASHVRRRLMQFAPDLIELKVDELAFGSPDGAPDADLQLMWYVKAKAGHCDVHARMEPLQGGLVSVDIDCDRER